MAEDVIEKDQLLRELGYSHPEAMGAARTVLIAERLTNARKTNIHIDKIERCRAVLASALIRLCNRCQKHPVDGRRLVPIRFPRECDSCHGQPNVNAMDRAIAACQRADIARIVLVGGAPVVHQELQQRWLEHLSIRIVPGDKRHTQQEARQNLQWAQVILVLGSTHLPHHISDLYTKALGDDFAVVVSVRRTGIEAIAVELQRHAELRLMHLPLRR
jgi:hypothetical protein